MNDINNKLNSLILFRAGQTSPLGKAAARLRNEGSFAFISELAGMAWEYGWSGNLWHCCLAQNLIESENPFSLSSERRAAAADGFRALALHDMEIYSKLFRIDFDSDTAALISSFENTSVSVSGCRVSELAAKLSTAADTAEGMLEVLTAHFMRNGPGMLGMSDVFRIEVIDGRAELYPIEQRRAVTLEDLVGYDTQKKLLLENTTAFIRGKHANNVLLYGDAGTGKSTSVQAIANRLAPEGLRIIEIFKHQFSAIPDLINKIKNRNYYFIIFLDDLSFEENEVDYKYLKAVLEGGAEAAPANIKVYATSNRRHLIKETWNDRNDMEHNGDIHRSDTMEEKLSLASRFGLQIFYPNPTFEEYHAIVSALAGKTGSSLSAEQLRKEASTWQVRSGSRSGRTAQQFIASLSSRESEEK